MTTARENEVLTRVGPDTPMGALMREYWIPVALSSEIKADGPPLRLMALGEKLIAFRDTSGRVGIMDHRCPHRCASLFYGRNEQDGIRCIYHGWKVDASGCVVDCPTQTVRADKFAASVPVAPEELEKRNEEIRKRFVEFFGA